MRPTVSPSASGRAGADGAVRPGLRHTADDGAGAPDAAGAVPAATSQPVPPPPAAPVVPAQPRPGLAADPEWFRTAVFYEALLRSFADSDADGTGDLRGLTSRLDYLAWLGVDCLWLPPFYPSPMRDGGYDISDYTAIDPRYGTMEDFRELVRQAHCRGIRIIIDLVLNHTSDAHPWFQASRSDPDGPYGDFYVWADDDSGYADARIIFVDTEESNWAYDAERGQYYWHRFFSHQPDLNFTSPAVREAVTDVVRFWARTGVDGFRLDAIPYLFEAEGTSCENLPDTHAFIAELRAVLDREFPGTITLAEANQWPEDVVAYFGTDQVPECSMCFHFPVMPRIFHALRAQSSTAVREVLTRTPAIPSGGQWGTFLRNHDELTLEMVTEAERAQMYAWYAPEDRMRANVGIRRRLAPLLDGSRAEIELANALLLSLPGSPCLYYGDEIGMGDDIWLEDRDAVRTPMQWSAGPNAGFSSTPDPGSLTLPLVQSPGYADLSVEAQLGNPDSLLSWTRRILHTRRAHPVLGRGDFTLRDAGDEAVLAHTRSDGEETVLCVANLADSPRAATIDLPEHAGARTVDLFDATGCPDVDATGRLALTLGGRAYAWLALTPAVGSAPRATTPQEPAVQGGPEEVPAP